MFGVYRMSVEYKAKTAVFVGGRRPSAAKGT